jgi:hypothetical protein
MTERGLDVLVRHSDNVDRPGDIAAKDTILRCGLLTIDCS